MKGILTIKTVHKWNGPQGKQRALWPSECGLWSVGKIIARISALMRERELAFKFFVLKFFEKYFGRNQVFLPLKE